MANPQLNWKEIVAEQAIRLQCEATLTGEGVGKYSRVRVVCPHGVHEVGAQQLCRKKKCCRHESGKGQPNRHEIAAKAAIKNRGRKASIETRIKNADETRKRGALRIQDDLLYVAVREGKVKVGRVALHQQRWWFKNMRLTVIDGWELESWAAFKLENEIHDQFGDRRPLDPSFGTGWTEVFDVDPKTLTNFIEERLLL